MGMSILITGGARSGKSRIAEAMALGHSGSAVYIATCRAYDDEMAERIASHQARRGAEWQSVTEHIDLAQALDDSDGERPRLIDCLTLWLSNLMEDGRDWRAETDRLVAALARQSAPVYLVTNEVGLGIVPENALARAFRDAAGEVNQAIAEASDEVYLAVSGYPMKVKPNASFPADVARSSR